MKFPVVALAVLAAAGIGAYWWNKKHPATNSAPAKAPYGSTDHQVGPAYTFDPYATLDDRGAPVDSISNYPITEAAYHQLPDGVMTGAFGSDENTGGEEVLNFI